MVTPPPDPEPAVPSASAETVWALMHGFVEAHNRHGELAEALGFRLGAGRGKALFLLRDAPLTLTQLAASIGADAPYTTLIVDKLESHGLVERLPHPADRRRKLVTLTPAGHDAIATADAILHRPPPALSALSRKDLAHLTALLTRLTSATGPAEPAEPADPAEPPR
ncbi:MarR family winged helix-turn-helix transcriptional regulator [Streptomyces sp. NPDC008079]|uniref:MarR family winged helix-turn-helix transcriptional regulator n=1 Tax=Streptomyces sp. NPDC008079 TaxID=3364806 RepID=UPI0036E6664C